MSPFMFAGPRKLLPPLLLISTTAVTIEAAIRPMQTFFEPPPEILLLQQPDKKGDILLQRLGLVSTSVQPLTTSLANDRKLFAQGWIYRRVDNKNNASGQITLWLKTATTSAPSNRTYLPVDRKEKSMPAKDAFSNQEGCLKFSSSQAHGVIKASPTESNLLEANSPSYKRLILWLLGLRPLSQQKCLTLLP